MILQSFLYTLKGHGNTQGAATYALDVHSPGNQDRDLLAAPPQLPGISPVCLFICLIVGV